MLKKNNVGPLCVIGLGYTGLPTAVLFAASGVPTTGVDIDESRVKSLSNGQLPFVEPGLGELLAQAIEKRTFTTQSEVPQASVYIIAVPTPLTDNHTLDSTHIYEAADAIAPVLSGEELIILESTCPPGTTDQLAKYISNLRPDLSLLEGQSNSVYFAHIPERVSPGDAIREIQENHRIIGGTTQTACTLAQNLYETFVSGGVTTTTAKTAELVKLTENTFRDINIAFANEIDLVAQRVGVNPQELIELANLHPRVNVLQPGPGVGGHCIPIDPWFLISSAPDEAQLARLARKINDTRPKDTVKKILRALATTPPKQLLCLGLTFKEDVDDVRESPAVKIVSILAEHLPKTEIYAVDPFLKELPGHLKPFTNVRFSPTIPNFLNDAPTALLVRHTRFIEMGFPDADHKHNLVYP